MSSHKRRALALDFVDRHGLWTEGRPAPRAAIEKTIKRMGLELVRFAFPDQHGILRGKTLVVAEALRALRAGVTMTSTLFAKDTSHRTAFPVFEAGAGMDVPEMGGAGNFLMVADPETFRVLPWAEKPAGCCATAISRTDGRCRSRRAPSIASFGKTRQGLGSTIALGSKSSFTCSRSTIFVSRPMR